MGAFIAVLGFLAFSVGFLMFVFSIFKKKKKAKSLLIMGVSMVFFITGATISGSNDVATQDSKPVADEKKDEKDPIKEDKEKGAEDQPTKEEPVAEKSVAFEEDTAIESQTNTKKTATDNPKNDWESKIDKIAQSKDSPTGKYDQVMILAKDYTPTKKEVEKFAVYIITEYQSKQYSADITNDEYMLKNIFRANVINNYIGKVNTPLNDFAFDFYQNTKYLYRGVDTVDSAAVRANERQMDKALAKM